MICWKSLLNWLRPTPKRDPKVDRVLAATQTTRMRRDREHRRLESSLSVALERDLSGHDRDRFAD